MKKFGLRWWLNTPRFAFNKISNRFFDRLSGEIAQKLQRQRGPAGAASSQLLFQMEIRRLVAVGKPLPALSDCGFKVYSQIDEDGILLAIFAIIARRIKQAWRFVPAKASSATPPI